MTPEQIKQLRRSLGLTQQQFADRLHVHRVTVAAWERGRQVPTGLSLRELQRLAARVARQTTK